jgi:hypothetical protein
VCLTVSKNATPTIHIKHIARQRRQTRINDKRKDVGVNSESLLWDLNPRPPAY